MTHCSGNLCDKELHFTQSVAFDVACVHSSELHATVQIMSAALQAANTTVVAPGPLLKGILLVCCVRRRCYCGEDSDRCRG